MIIVTAVRLFILQNNLSVGITIDLEILKLLRDLLNWKGLFLLDYQYLSLIKIFNCPSWSPLIFVLSRFSIVFLIIWYF
jgi:hypothetical protein